MKTVKQDFYDSFMCLADKCPKTCCQGWQVIRDDGSLMPFKEGKCVNLTENGLCSIVLAKGEEAIDYVCHMYPRHVEEYDGVREWSLSISCPEAARIVVTSSTKAAYIVTEDDEPEPMSDDFDDFDYMLYSNLESAREVLYGIIQSDKLNFPTKLKAILDMAYELQECYDNDEAYLMEDIIGKWSNTDLIEGVIEFNPNDFFIQNRNLLNRMEILAPDWTDVLNCASSMEKAVCTPFDGEWELIKENILMSFVYTYFLGASYTGMIYSKTALCVYGMLMIDILAVGVFGKDGIVSKEKYIEMVYRFAKETEHSTENLNAIEEYWDMKKFEYFA